MDTDQAARLNDLAKKSIIQDGDIYKVKFDRPVMGIDLTLTYPDREAAETAALKALLNHYEIREKKIKERI